jgi:cell division protein FtsN
MMRASSSGSGLNPLARRISFQRPRLARIVFGAAIAAVLLAGAIGIGVWIVSSQAPSPHATQTKIVYPEIPGDLGTHLKQLEKAVAP